MNSASRPDSRSDPGGRSWLLALALGALTMYFGDPAQGGRRRALLRDRASRVGRVLIAAGEAAARDAAHRARGWSARLMRSVRIASVSDQVVTERVRAALGRVVSHPHALKVAVRGGYVLVGGPILEREKLALLERIRGVPGVRGVEDCLSVHKHAGRISALQGGRAASGERAEWMQHDWSPGARALGGLLGAALVITGAAKGRWLGYGFVAAGSALIARSACNRELAALIGVGPETRGLVVQKAINIDANADELYDFWRHCENFPRFMSRVIDVRLLGGNLSHWVVRGPGGMPVEWTAELVRAIPGQLMEWRCLEASAVRHSGSVRFDPNDNGGTRVQVRLCYQPPAGVLGHLVAKLFGADPKSELDADLMRMKSMIETGRVPHDSARSVRAGAGIKPDVSHPVAGARA